jgi:tetratricopeptide (TPR) repeat protein
VKNKFLFIFLFFIILKSAAATTTNDSLQSLLKNASHDTVRITLLIKLAALSELPERLDLLKSALEISERADNKKLLLETFNEIATAYNFIGDVNNAMDYFGRALSVAEEIG